MQEFHFPHNLKNASSTKKYSQPEKTKPVIPSQLSLSKLIPFTVYYSMSGQKISKASTTSTLENN